jgi:hypothetical protein
MKTKKLSHSLLIALLLTSTGLFAQKNTEPIYISAPKFAQPLVQNWITEYAKVHPGNNLQIVGNDSKGHTPQLKLVMEPSSENNDQKILFAARYALLPVANAKNRILTQVGKKRLDKKDVDKLFFEPLLEEDEETAEIKPSYQVTVYSAENQARLSGFLANHYGHLSSELRGKKVLGDEIYLLSALKKDTTGVSFNNLNYLFDLNSRNLKPEIALLPIDVKKEERVLLNGDADDVIALLESSSVESIPVGRIGFTLESSTSEILTAFVQWTLTEGQKQNHQQGFLQATETDLRTAQNELKTGKLLTSY